MKNIGTWKIIGQSLQEHTPVMLLYVLQSEGSSPGRQGFFMAVNEQGAMEGSIGGGIMEHKFVEMAKERLKVQGTRYKVQVKKQYHDKSVVKDQSGMICSGEQTILLYIVQEKDKKAVQHIISSLEQNHNGTLLLSPAGISFDDSIPEKDFYYSFQSEEDWLYQEKTGCKSHLFIIGGGHCALALSTLMRSMDFYVHVYDDRTELKTMLENNTAHEKHFVNDYAELKDMIPSGNDHYVVIMTMGYRTDDTAIRALMEKQFRYLGMLGSQTKTQKMIKQYREEGIQEDVLQRIHAPAGLLIKSQTPEEIAVSIAAQIISIKNKQG
jgi:xanthine dehydrogenase accessory factor